MISYKFLRGKAKKNFKSHAAAPYVNLNFVLFYLALI